ncbi:hypothetical protein [Paraliomyxa miuraensis]|uniref:hypothetical protein n=1 Tax=Paraliomyxa miuraensis TaxID=376150 RepID=UPI00225B551F|nr:hypothetical protein [Paraliomyxa miuraensis]MCX4243693.1 hypothetical protein [Paraliomyxa miuraensis]
MTTIGILSEGRTDQAVIKQVLLGYFADQGAALDALEINSFFPPEIPLPGEPEEGGWTVLKRRLQDGHHLQALGFNDYLVIHIDTDVCDHPGYDVSRRDPSTGSSLDPWQLREAARARLVEWMGADFHAKHGHRVLFAIAVDTIECWLLPLLEDKRAKQSKTIGCAKAANEALKRAGRDALDQGNVLRRYTEEAAPYRKRKTLLTTGRQSPSLGAFLAELTELDIQLGVG